MPTWTSFSPPSPPAGSAWSSRQGMLLLQSNVVSLNTADSVGWPVRVVVEGSSANFFAVATCLWSGTETTIQAPWAFQPHRRPVNFWRSVSAGCGAGDPKRQTFPRRNCNEFVFQSMRVTGGRRPA